MVHNVAVGDVDATPERFQSRAARLSRIIGAATDDTIGVAIETCLEEVGRGAGVDAAAAMLVDEHECIVGDWAWLRPGHDVISPGVGAPLADAFGSATEFLRLGHTVEVRDLATIDLSPTEQALSQRNQLRALAIAPVMVDGSLVGITGLLVQGRPHDWERNVVEQLELVAQLLVNAVSRTRTRGALEVANARARRIAEFIPDGLLLVDLAGAITWASPSFLRSSPMVEDELRGRALPEVVHPDDRELLARRMRDDPVEGFGLTVRLLVRDGWRWSDLSWQRVHEPDEAIPDELVVTLRDVHDRHLHTEQLSRATEEDPLTGLCNRVGLEHALEELAGDDAQVLVAFVDIDDFKAVNDARGHDVGDAALCQIAAALTSAVRTTDLAARLGGDEFCVVTRADHAPGDEARALGARLVDVIGAATASAPAPDGLEVGVTVSVGVAGPGPAVDAAALFRAADQAMYRAKRAGKARYAVATDAGDGSPGC